MPIVEFVSVSKAYVIPRRSARFLHHLVFGDKQDSRQVLSDFSFAARPGEKIIVAGANGQGKTTVLKLAGGFIRPELGEVRIFGKSARRAPREKIGLMLSTQLLYPTLTGFQNLEYTGHLMKLADWRARVDRAAEEWGLRDFLFQQVSSYSNGRRALLALARATFADPSVLLLDEPTSYLDTANSARLVEYLSRSPATTFVTTQEPDLFTGIPFRRLDL